MLAIVNQLTKIVYYELVKIIIDTLELGKVIFNMIIWYQNVHNLIIIDRNLFFISKF